MKNYKVLIAGYDLEEIYHRGIAYYAKSLIKSLHDINLETLLLTSAKNTDEDIILYKNILYLLSGDYIKIKEKTNLMKKYASISILFFKYFKNKLIGSNYRVINNIYNPYDYQDRLLYLKYISKFYNIPNVYKYTSIHNRLFTKRPYKLKINPSSVDLIITTSPMNIRSNIPTIQTLHDVMPIKLGLHPKDDNPKIFYYRVKNMLNFSNKVLVNSNFTKKECLEIFPNYEDKLFVVHLPVPIYEDIEKLINKKFVNVSVLKKYNLEKDNYLIFVGALEKRKNIKRLIEAYLSIYEKIKIPLVLVGKFGYGYKDFIGYIKDFKDKIKYIGVVNDIDKLVLMKNSRAFLFPSIYEGFGLPPLEAMYLKVPVLVSNTAALPEVCEKAALYVNPFSIDSIAEGILEITCNENLRKNLIKLGNKQVEKFSFENFKNKLREVLNHI